jgi:uncharacterized protein (TIGR02145 family)
MKKLLLLTLAIVTLTNLGYSQTVTIGTQVWTSKNLDVATYRNGDVIPQVQDEKAWAELTTGAWCYYDNDPANGTKYGKLYNWYAVNDARGLAPQGYHIPSDAEWSQLTDYLGGEKAAGTKMKSVSGWKSYTTGGSKTCPNCSSWNAEYRKKVPCHTCKDTRSVPAPTVMKSGNGSNSSKFSGLPVGLRGVESYGSGDIGAFYGVDGSGGWWSSSRSSNSLDHAYSRDLSYNYSRVFSSSYNKDYGLSVRCIKDPHLTSINSTDKLKDRNPEIEILSESELKEFFEKNIDMMAFVRGDVKYEKKRIDITYKFVINEFGKVSSLKFCIGNVMFNGQEGIQNAIDLSESQFSSINAEIQRLFSILPNLMGVLPNKTYLFDVISSDRFEETQSLPPGLSFSELSLIDLD